MRNNQFHNANLVLAESNKQIRLGLKGTLLSRGFHNIRDIGDFSQLHTLAAVTAPDIIISDIAFGGGDVCQLFHDIRHHRIGSNPFVLIIGLSWSGEFEVVRKAIDSGADDLLVKPVSTDQLLGRIDRLVHFRKPFVVTSDYIGPDRRKTPRQEGETPYLIDVPNTLREKTVQRRRVNAEALQEEIDATAALINEHKMERHACQIGQIVDNLQPQSGEGAAGGEHGETLNRLLYVTGDLARRMKGTRFDHISGLCGSLLKVVREAGGALNPRDHDLMRKLSQAIRSAFTDDADVIAAAHDISESVKKGSVNA